MKHWQENQFSRLHAIHCEHQLFQALTGAARDLGFDHCAYGLRLPLPLSNPKTEIFNNYPKVWQTRYKEQNYVAIDPSVQRGIRSLVPVVWSDELFVSACDFWEDANSFGLRFGWAQSCRDIDGVTGMLTLARSSEPLLDAELRDKELKMVWLAQVAHSEMSRLLTKKIMPETTIRLSSREVCILRWTADGKTSADISDILGISERTVNFHINNAILKLNAANKTAATVRAAMLGML